MLPKQDLPILSCEVPSEDQAWALLGTDIGIPTSTVTFLAFVTFALKILRLTLSSSLCYRTLGAGVNPRLHVHCLFFFFTFCSLYSNIPPGMTVSILSARADIHMFIASQCLHLQPRIILWTWCYSTLKEKLSGKWACGSVFLLDIQPSVLGLNQLWPWFHYSGNQGVFTEFYFGLMPSAIKGESKRKR